MGREPAGVRCAVTGARAAGGEEADETPHQRELRTLRGPARVFWGEPRKDRAGIRGLQTGVGRLEARKGGQEQEERGQREPRRGLCRRLSATRVHRVNWRQSGTPLETSEKSGLEAGGERHPTRRARESWGGRGNDALVKERWAGGTNSSAQRDFMVKSFPRPKRVRLTIVHEFTQQRDTGTLRTVCTCTSSLHCKRDQAHAGVTTKRTTAPPPRTRAPAEPSVESGEETVIQDVGDVSGTRSERDPLSATVRVRARGRPG